MGVKLVARVLVEFFRFVVFVWVLIFTGLVVGVCCLMFCV